MQNALTVAKIVALAALILGRLRCYGRGGRARSGGRRAAASGSLRQWIRGGVCRGAVHHRWLAADEHGGRRDPATRVDDPARADVSASLIVIAIYLGANAVYVHVAWARRAGGERRGGGRYRGAAGRVRSAATLITVGAMLSILGFVNVVLVRQLAHAVRHGARRALSRRGRAGSIRGSARRMWRSGSWSAWSLVLLFGTRGELGALLSRRGVRGLDLLRARRRRACSCCGGRARMPRGPIESLGYPVLPALFVVAAVVGIVSAFVAAPKTSLFGTALLLAGVGVTSVMVTGQKTGSRRASALIHADVSLRNRPDSA